MQTVRAGQFATNQQLRAMASTATPTVRAGAAQLVKDFAVNSIEAGLYFTEEAICLGAVSTLQLLNDQGNIDNIELAIE